MTLLDEIHSYILAHDLGTVIREPNALPPSCPMAVRSGGALAYFLPTTRTQLHSAWRQAQSEIALFPVAQVQTPGRFLTLLVNDEDEAEQEWEKITSDFFVCRKLVIPVKEKQPGDWINTLPFLPIRHEGRTQSSTSPVEVLTTHHFAEELGHALLNQRPGSDVMAQALVEGRHLAVTRPDGGQTVAPANATISNRLASLSVQNFRGFSSTFSLSLNADLIVIYGPNGSGKTSICQALEFGTIGEVDSLRERPKDETWLQQNTSPYLNAEHKDKPGWVRLGFASQPLMLQRIIKPDGQAESALLSAANLQAPGKRQTESEALEFALAPAPGGYADVRKLRVVARQAHFLDQDTIRNWLKEDPKARFDALSRLTGTADFQQARAKLKNVKEAVAKVIADAQAPLNKSSDKLGLLRMQKEREFAHYERTGVTGEYVTTCEARARDYFQRASDLIREPAPPDAIGLATVGAVVVTKASGAIKARLHLYDTVALREKELDTTFPDLQETERALASMRFEGNTLQQAETRLHNRRQRLQGALTNTRDQAIAAELHTHHLAQQLDAVSAFRENTKDLKALREQETNDLKEHRHAQQSAEEARLKLEAVQSRRALLADQQNERTRQAAVLMRLAERLPRMVAQRTRLLTIDTDLAALVKELDRLQLLQQEQKRVLEIRQAEEQRTRGRLGRAQERYGSWKSLLAEISKHITHETCPLCGWKHESVGELQRRVDIRLSAVPDEVIETQAEVKIAQQEREAAELVVAETVNQVEQRQRQQSDLEQEAQRLQAEWDAWVTEALRLGSHVSVPDSVEPTTPPHLLETWQAALPPDVAAAIQAATELEETLQSAYDDLTRTARTAQGRAEQSSHERIRTEGRVHQAQARLAALGLDPSALTSQEDLLKQHAEAAERFQRLESTCRRVELLLVDLGHRLVAVQAEVARNQERQNRSREALQAIAQLRNDYEAACRAAGLDPGTSVQALQAEANHQLQRLSQVQAAVEELAVLLNKLRGDEAYTRLQAQIEQVEKQIRTQTEDLARAEAAERLLDKADTVLKEGAEDEQRARLKAYEPLINEIYQRINAHPKYPYLRLTVEEQNVLCHALRHQTDQQPITVPRYFSMAQQNVVALAVFLSAALLQSWSGLQTICIDDPIQQMDDLNPTAFLDVLRGILERQDRKHQIVLTTSNREFYKLVIARYAYLNEHDQGGLLAYRLISTPDGTRPLDDSPVIDESGLVTLRSATTSKRVH